MRYKLFCYITFFILIATGCTKQNTIAKPSTLDGSLLTAHRWLITPNPRILTHATERFSQYFMDTVKMFDTTILVFRNDSTWRDRKFVIERWALGTTPLLPPYAGNYLPMGGWDYSGTYSLNTSDSTVTSTLQLTGIVLPPLTRKILLLTNDSLKLYHPIEGIRSYYSW